MPQPRAAHELGRQEHRREASGDARNGVRRGEPHVCAFDHLHELDHHRRERRQRAADAGAEERAAIQRRRQALLKARDEVAEQRRAKQVHRECRPRPFVRSRDEALRERSARDRADEAAREDRGELLAVELRPRVLDRASSLRGEHSGPT